MLDDANERVPAAGVSADLVYVNDRMPGITRRRRGGGFSYLDSQGKPIHCALERARIVALGIPPAYEQVWICPLPNGHIQAIGFDQRRRKQYLYHPEWSRSRAQAKFSLLLPFGAALGGLRARLDRDLERDPGDLAFSLAALTTLLDRAQLRVGNPAHTRANKTYGATTLLGRHLFLGDDAVQLRFRAKGGKRVVRTLRGARLHRIFQQIGELPGRNLFTYIGADGVVHPLLSQQVNGYIANISGVPGATAKTFRTWAGSVEAFALAEATAGRLTIRAMAEAAAARLHNTPAISRSAYIHPDVLSLAEMNPADRQGLLDIPTPASSARLRPVERRFLHFLDRRS